MHKATPDQLAQVGQLLKAQLSSPEIAERVGVSVGTVRAVKAWNTIREVRGGGAEPAPDDLPEATDIDDAFQVAVGLERDLQQALRGNLAQLEAGLRVDDAGRERKTAAGFIDIFARDAQGRPVVIELKTGVASDSSLAQVLAYMDAIRESDGGEVRGFLVAGDFSDRLRRAARLAAGLELRRYELLFRFAAAPSLGAGRV